MSTLAFLGLLALVIVAGGCALTSLAFFVLSLFENFRD
jgi:hypothetical protein